VTGTVDEPPISAAASFGVAAAAYERGRPQYPNEAVEWLLPSAARRVLDLGAGTGKLTGLLQRRGLDVVAVEPLSGMRDRLAAALPEVTLLAGTAEAIPVEDGVVDAVLVAQAWHWVNPMLAIPEVARVLAPGGRLGLLWNIRDERESWVRDLGRLMHAHGERDSDGPKPAVGPPFGPIEHREVAWKHWLTRASLVDLVASRSYVITLPREERDAVLADVRRLADTHPDLAGAERFPLPYLTQCFRADLR
jgi:SAM-dependent methyltransferase